jgi:hypothetical protein
VRISRIRLSRRFHTKACSGPPRCRPSLRTLRSSKTFPVENCLDPRERTLWRRLRSQTPPWPSHKACAGASRSSRGCQAHHQYPAHRPHRCKHIAGRGPSLHRHYPASSVLWPPPTSAPSGPLRDVRVAIPTARISPVAHTPFSGMLLPLTPVDQTGAPVDSSPSIGAFPEIGAGRRPRFRFRGLLGIQLVTACWIARPPSAAFVTRLRPGSCPPTVARQLPSPIDLARVVSSSTGSMIVSGHTPSYVLRIV